MKTFTQENNKNIADKLYEFFAYIIEDEYQLEILENAKSIRQYVYTYHDFRISIEQSERLSNGLERYKYSRQMFQGNFDDLLNIIKIECLEGVHPI